MSSFVRIVVFLLFVFPSTALAHAPNQSYIYLRIYEGQNIEGRFEITALDINKIYGSNLDKKASFEDMQPYIKKLQAYLLEHAKFSSTNGVHDITFLETTKADVGLGSFLKVKFVLENTVELPDNLNVSYSVIFDRDNTHAGFLMMEYNWRAGVINNEANISLRFSKNQTTDVLSLTDVSVWKGFVAMVKQGIWHIWIGLDHILFLFALILPAVVRRWSTATKGEKGTRTAPKANAGFITWDWFPVARFKPALLYIVKVITFFTLAHTITLSLASLQIINLPSRMVEAIIALSIGLAAYHNIRPIFKGKDWVIAFVFGLFHGFGFASVLADLGLTSEYLTLSLLGFNVGVEIGQLVIILMIFPVLFFLRKRKLYPKLLVYCSLLLILISIYWFVERAFDIDIRWDENLRMWLGKLLRWIGVLPPIPDYLE